MSAVRLAANAMGTRFEVVLFPPPGRAILEHAGQMALEEIAEQHARLSAFRRDSVVSLLNREAHRRPVGVDGEMLELLALCRHLREQTQGAFDPALGHLMRLHGFRPDGDAPPRPPLSSEELAALRERVGLRHVRCEAESGTVRFTHAEVQLDLGAIAKGWALDLAGELLREAGVQHALLHGGTSTILALGPPAEAPPFRILVHGGEGVRPLRVPLRDRALSVSAQRGREGPRGGHVLDPRKGGPAAADREAPSTAIVGHASAARADAFSTALLVDPRLGPGLEGAASGLLTPGGLREAHGTQTRDWLPGPDGEGSA